MSILSHGTDAAPEPANIACGWRIRQWRGADGSGACGRSENEPALPADSEAPDRILERDAGKGWDAVRRTGPLSEAMRCGQAVEEIVCRNLQRPEMTQVADQNGPVAAHGREGSVQGNWEVDVEED